MQRRAGLDLGIAQVGQRVRGDRLMARRLALRAGAFDHRRRRRRERGAGLFDLSRGLLVVDQHGERLGAADLGLHLAVALRLPGLATQPVALGGDLGDHVVDAGEVVLGALQPQLGLVAARVQAGDARRLLENAPTRLRLGADDLGDLPLPDERWRTGAGGGVGEQDLHVAGAHLAAVDAVGRTLLAPDAAGDLEHVGIVERGRRGPRGIVEDEADLGHVARRPIAAAGEDHVVHARRAHALVGAFAHHPAQRLDEVRLAAPVRPDDARQPRLDLEIGRLDEALEADEAEFGEVHGPAGRVCRISRVRHGRRLASGAKWWCVDKLRCARRATPQERY